MSKIEFACPLCDRYSGGRKSVLAHISGMQDEAHGGYLGRDFEGDLKSVDGPSEELVEFPTEDVEDLKLEEDEDGSDILSLAIGGAAAYVLYKALTGQNDIKYRRGDYRR